MSKVKIAGVCDTFDIIELIPRVRQTCRSGYIRELSVRNALRLACAPPDRVGGGKGSHNFMGGPSWFGPLAPFSYHQNMWERAGKLGDAR